MLIHVELVISLGFISGLSAVSFYYIHSYSRPDVAWYMKLLVWISSVLLITILILVPLDVVESVKSIDIDAEESDIRSFLPKLWRVIYWSSIIFTWVILPFISNLDQSGEFRTFPRLRATFASRCFFILIMLGILCLALLGLQYMFEFTISLPIIAMLLGTLSNTWALVQLMLLMGTGMVYVPDRLLDKLEATYEKWRTNLHMQASGVYDSYKSAQYDLISLRKECSTLERILKKRLDEGCPDEKGCWENNFSLCWSDEGMRNHEKVTHVARLIDEKHYFDNRLFWTNDEAPLMETGFFAMLRNNFNLGHTQDAERRLCHSDLVNLHFRAKRALRHVSRVRSRWDSVLEQSLWVMYLSYIDQGLVPDMVFATSILASNNNNNNANSFNASNGANNRDDMQPLLISSDPLTVDLSEGVSNEGLHFAAFKGNDRKDLNMNLVVGESNVGDDLLDDAQDYIDDDFMDDLMSGIITENELNDGDSKENVGSKTPPFQSNSPGNGRRAFRKNEIELATINSPNHSIFRVINDDDQDNHNDEGLTATKSERNLVQTERWRDELENRRKARKTGHSLPTGGSVHVQRDNKHSLNRMDWRDKRRKLEEGYSKEETDRLERQILPKISRFFGRLNYLEYLVFIKYRRPLYTCMFALFMLLVVSIGIGQVSIGLKASHGSYSPLAWIVAAVAPLPYVENKGYGSERIPRRNKRLYDVLSEGEFGELLLELNGGEEKSRILQSKRVESDIGLYEQEVEDEENVDSTLHRSEDEIWVGNAALRGAQEGGGDMSSIVTEDGAAADENEDTIDTSLKNRDMNKDDGESTNTGESSSKFDSATARSSILNFFTRVFTRDEMESPPLLLLYMTVSLLLLSFAAITYIPVLSARFSDSYGLYSKHETDGISLATAVMLSLRLAPALAFNFLVLIDGAKGTSAFEHFYGNMFASIPLLGALPTYVPLLCVVVALLFACNVFACIMQMFGAEMLGFEVFAQVDVIDMSPAAGHAKMLHAARKFIRGHSDILGRKLNGTHITDQHQERDMRLVLAPIGQRDDAEFEIDPKNRW